MNGLLDVEVYDGRVVAVWSNCQLLPFEQHDVDQARAAECGGSPAGRITERIALRHDAGATR